MGEQFVEQGASWWRSLLPRVVEVTVHDANGLVGVIDRHLPPDDVAGGPLGLDSDAARLANAAGYYRVVKE